MLFAFNPITGEPLDGQSSSGIHLNYELSTAALLAEMDEHFLKPVLLIDTEKKVNASLTSSQYYLNIHIALK